MHFEEDLELGSVVVEHLKRNRLEHEVVAIGTWSRVLERHSIATGKRRVYASSDLALSWISMVVLEDDQEVERVASVDIAVGSFMNKCLKLQVWDIPRQIYLNIFFSRPNVHVTRDKFISIGVLARDDKGAFHRS